MKQFFPGVYSFGGKAATLNMVKGISVYGEKRIQVGKDEFRIWEEKRSKLAAAVLKGIKNLPIKEGSKILYLGAANGTTVSHVSDIVGLNGFVYAVEFAPRSMSDLISLSEKRKNIFPIFADARFPERYAEVGKVDVVYADLSDPQQVEILLRNAVFFKSGFVMIALKARCVDSSEKPKVIYDKSRKELEEKCRILDFVILDPFEVDHGFFVGEVKS
ncbi:MAG: fibrillarin-like rRNA/tRNA 2'-O-methyltransferase [Candidatus Marsarchaeota archaeon]|nr:fibrillarin-like rRNA/tRNA 2'-O-methyltransferase [Candidatus Marsarchaeota archaeon]